MVLVITTTILPLHVCLFGSIYITDVNFPPTSLQHACACPPHIRQRAKCYSILGGIFGYCVCMCMGSWGGWGHPSKHFPLWLMEGRWGGMLDQTLRLEPLSAPLLYVITFSLIDATTGMPSDIYFSKTWDVFIGRDCIQDWLCRSIN